MAPSSVDQVTTWPATTSPSRLTSLPSTACGNAWTRKLTLLPASQVCHYTAHSCRSPDDRLDGLDGLLRHWPGCLHHCSYRPLKET